MSSLGNTFLIDCKVSESTRKWFTSEQFGDCLGLEIHWRMVVAAESQATLKASYPCVHVL